MVFLGNHEWSVPTLGALAESSHDVALVVTRQPAPGRRGGAERPTPVSEDAARRGLPLLETATVKSGVGLAALQHAHPDVLVVVAYGELLPAGVLGLAPRGALNVHFSLLPKLRGASPVQSAILEGTEVTGVSVMALDEGMDTGPVFAQEPEPIEAADDTGSLGARLALSGAKLLVNVLDELEAGAINSVPQDEGDATNAPKFSTADRRLDWTQSAESLSRRIRAFAPAPGAFAKLGDSLVKILAARVESNLPDRAKRPPEPGEVLSVSPPDGLLVATGDQALAVVTVAPEGRKHMSAAEFVRGSTIEPGDRLG